ncbi:MAG TPA: DUF1801 domain-containing protein [Bacteroidia bacterium]|jgi:uncharacterized protein YdhG (YjbR/CyaY superfamily)|nr:DUF1801 domain-containing protein [Bacteroidia bacterium]
MKKPKDVDEYIASFPKETQKLLKEVRAAIQEAAPQAEEVISYSMPAYRLNGIVVWFGGHTHHIGFYPHGATMEKFKKELARYKQTKGSIRFPMDEPIPIALIKKMVKLRVKEHLEKGKK